MTSDVDDPRGRPPAGLGGHLPYSPTRPGRGVVAAVLLVGLAALALWAALTGIGPGRADGALLADAVDARTDGLTALALVVTNVGNTVAMAVLAVVAGFRSWTAGRRPDAVLVVGAMAGASLLFRGLKLLIDRPRPPAAAQLISETNESLPSGHATMSMVVIGSLVVSAWAGRGAMGRLVIVSAAAVWVGAVGATRVYLGVHWVSDVIAGWLVGAAWLALCVAAWSWWRRTPLARPDGGRSSGP